MARKRETPYTENIIAGKIFFPFQIFPSIYPPLTKYNVKIIALKQMPANILEIL